MAKFTEAEKLNILMLFLNQMWSASVLGEGQSYHQTVRHSAHLRRWVLVTGGWLCWLNCAW